MVEVLATKDIYSETEKNKTLVPKGGVVPPEVVKQYETQDPSALSTSILMSGIWRTPKEVEELYAKAKAVKSEEPVPEAGEKKGQLEVKRKPK